MINKISYLLFVYIASIAFSFAQENVKTLKYNSIDNGIENKERSKKVYFSNNIFYFSDKIYKINEFIDYNRNIRVDYLSLKDKNYLHATNIGDGFKPEKIEDADEIAGFKCKKATYKAFSNTIEVWFTTQSDVKGSLYKAYLPENSLVTKILINGSRGWILDSIYLEKKEIENYNFEESEQVSMSVYQELLIESRYERLNIYNKQQLNWGDEIKIPDELKNNVVYRFGGGTIVMKKVKIPEELRKNKIVFAEITNWSNGDAYDRTGSLFCVPASQVEDEKVVTILDAYMKGIKVFPTIKDNQNREYKGLANKDDYISPIELVRFFTSFGVSNFNEKRVINNYNWADSVYYKQEITQVFPDEEYVWLGAMIGNYDKGGHYLSVDLSFYPTWESKNSEKFILPLAYTLNTLEMKGQPACRIFETDTLEIDFNIEENLKNEQFLFTSTGHGGWGGGDEFNPKLNEIYLDGKLIYSVVPWRTDCATYRMSNPASGNFENGLSSSDLSRSNWCPATLTPPYLIPLKDLEKGNHKVKIVIDQGMPEGNSASAWNLSLILVGDK
jgi:hypothetical protein